MSVKIRLTRLGDKKSPFYRVVVADSRKSRDGEVIDNLGYYNPLVEKDALKILRKAKADRKEDFGKKLSKVKAEALFETKHAPILPYYLITNGGWLSDEYRLLSVDESIAETKEFYNLLESEELLEAKPDGIVICTCANGDWVLQLRDGAVIRFSHETPEITEKWPSLEQFIVDSIND